MRRDLHDQVGSPLAGLIMEVELARQLVNKGDAQAASVVLTEVREDLIELMARTRDIGSNSDTTQTAWDLERALRTMLYRINRAVAPRLRISLDADPGIRTVREEIGRTAFWIIREAVTNVLKHSNGRNCTVTLRIQGHGLRMLVADNGRVPRWRQQRTGSGLSNMAARAEELGGWCAAAPGCGGFIVSVYIPTMPPPSAVFNPLKMHGKFRQ